MVPRHHKKEGHFSQRWKALEDLQPHTASREQVADRIPHLPRKVIRALLRQE